MNIERLEELLDRYFDGGLSAGELHQLSELLESESTARDYYWRHANTHGALCRWGAAQAGVREIATARTLACLSVDGSPTASLSKESEVGSTDEVAPAIILPESTPPVKSPVLGFLGGAMDYVNHSRMLMFWLVALSVGGWFAFQLGSLMMGRARPGDAKVARQPVGPNSQEVSTPPGGLFAPPASPHQSDSVAWMTAVVDCHWRVVPPAVPPASAPAPGDEDTVLYNGEPFHVGSELSAGRQLDLVRGLAEITFRSGARIVLNGPAHFTIGSPLGGKLQIGKLTARVPHDAHGFTVNTPAGKVVDLGTEFGVAVAPNHTMDVEVFVGEVAVDSAAVDASSSDGQTPSSPSATPTKPQKLTAGHAAHVEAGKPVANEPLDPNRFVRGLGPREDPQVAQAAYLDFVRSLKPAVWFRMEGKDTDRVLHDEMGGADAKLVWDGPGNPFVEGSAGKCLWLRGPQLGDYALLPSYPQAEHGKLSVSAWAYANGRSSYAQIVGNWADPMVGQFVLNLGADGSDILVALNQRDGQHVLLREGLSHPFPLHQWQHLAFVADGSTLRLYRQGREVASAKHAGIQYPVPLKSLSLGAYQGKQGAELCKSNPCWWDGKIDEIAIFNDALSADDIRKLAAAPPQ